jgi:hypothetical protein
VQRGICGRVPLLPRRRRLLLPALQRQLRADPQHGARRWTKAFETLQERRRRELEQFEDRQRAELEAFSAELRTIATREKPPGAPAKPRGFFSF